MIPTRPIDDAWLGRLRERGFTADTVFNQGEHEDLKDLLLGLGGSACILKEKEPDKDKILLRGFLYVPESGQFWEGLDNECHSNAAWAYREHGFRIATGYALSEDGAWRQHSWNLNEHDHVLESTEVRLAYYGFILTSDEAATFVQANLKD
jgi:hypothetical protein